MSQRRDGTALQGETMQSRGGIVTRLAVLGIPLALAACQPVHTTGKASPPSEAAIKQMDERVQAYFKKTVNIPPNVSMKLLDVTPADLPGVLTANLELSNGAQTQKVPVVLSADGRFLIQGALTDLSVDPDKAIMAKISLKDLPMRGNPNAAVTIVEYSDFQCPFCARAYKTLEDQVLKEYGEKVRLVFKNFPLTSIHPWAEAAGLAAACVRQQNPDGFWKLYDFFFQNQKDITPQNVKEKAEGAVQEAGLDVAAFDACFDNKTAMPSVKAEMDEATALGVRSTPTFFINGRKLEGALPYESFKTTLDQQLGGPAAAGTAPRNPEP